MDTAPSRATTGSSAEESPPVIDIVYAYHNFQAEQDDELSMDYGERIEVFEKDEEYNDGWWMGQNSRGTMGLFPQTHTGHTWPPARAAAAPGANTPEGYRAKLAAAASALDADRQGATARGASGDSDPYAHDPYAQAFDQSDDSSDGEIPPPRASGIDAATAAALAAPKSDWHSKLNVPSNIQAQGGAWRPAHVPAGAVPPPQPSLAKGGPVSFGGIEPRPDYSVSDIKPGALATGGATPVATGGATPAAEAKAAEAPPSTAAPPASAGEAALAAALKKQGAAAPPTTAPTNGSATLGSFPHSPPRDAPAPLGMPGMPGSTLPEPLAEPPTEPTEPTESLPVSPDTRRVSTIPSASSASYGGAYSAPTTAGYDTAGYDAAKSPLASPLDDRALPADPRDWSVAHVCAWGFHRGFDHAIIDKFRAHEISGDILLQLDVNTLKEIDIHAFGKRVHIANAIRALSGDAGAASTTSPSAGDTGATSTTSPSATAPSTTAPSAMTASAASPPATAPSTTAPSAMTPPAAAPPSHDAHPSIAAPALGAAAAGTAAAGAHADSSHAHGRGLDHLIRKSRQSSGRSFSNAPPTRETPTRLDADAPHDTPAAASFYSAQSPTAAPVTDAKRSASPTTATTLPTTATTLPSAATTLPSAAPASTGTAPPSAAPQLPPTASQPPPTGPTGLPITTYLPPIQKDTSPKSFFRRGRKAPPATPERSNSSRRSRLFGLFSDSDTAQPMSSEYIDPTSGLQQPHDALAVPAVGIPIIAQIGPPDAEGWIEKKSDSSPTWKSRYLLLKGDSLYVLKSRDESRYKQIISLRGYSVAPDSNVMRIGEHGFKIQGDGLKPHFFSSPDLTITKSWMKDILKATIKRDYAQPVSSSSNIHTIPLDVAQNMYPRPRPPSPESRAKMQRERQGNPDFNPNSLTPSQASVLMNAPGGLASTASQPAARRRSQNRSVSSRSSADAYAYDAYPHPSQAVPANYPAANYPTTAAYTSPNPNYTSANYTSPNHTSPNPNYTSAAYTNPRASAPPAASLPVVASPNIATSPLPADTHALISFVNSHVPPQLTVADLSASLRSGEVITRLVENLSGTSSGITAADFRKYKPPTLERPFDPDYFDVCFSVFDYLGAAGINTDDISMDDVLSGREPKLVDLIHRIQTKYA